MSWRDLRGMSLNMGMFIFHRPALLAIFFRLTAIERERTTRRRAAGARANAEQRPLEHATWVP